MRPGALLPIAMASLDLRGKFAKLKDNFQTSFTSPKGVRSIGFAKEAGHEDEPIFKGLSPVDDVEDFPITDSFQLPTTKPSDARQLPLNNPHRERDVLASISEEYYRDAEDFDPSLMELEKLPAEVDINALNSDRQVMKEQVNVISKRMSDLILEKHPSYAAELTKVAGIQKSLLLAYDVCLTARSSLKTSQGSVSASGIRLLAHHRKLSQLKRLLGELETIKTLQETELRLRELLEDGHYVAAIQLCLQCQKAATVYQHYDCIGELHEKLGRMLGGLEEELGLAAAALCLAFDQGRFQQLATAYRLLGKEQLNAAWLLERVLLGVESTSKSLLLDQLRRGGAEDPGDPDELHLRDLAKKLGAEELATAVRDLCVLLWRIFASYHAMIRCQSELGESEVAGLREGLPLVFRAAAEQLHVLVDVGDVGGLQFAQFLRLLTAYRSFSEIGRRHFGAEAEELTETLAGVARAYFKNYHRSRMEELRAFLDSEAWEPCPLSKNFTLVKLPEFHFLSSRGEGSAAVASPESEAAGPAVVPILPDAPDPFLAALPTTTAEPESESSEESDTDEALKKDFVDEGGPRRESLRPVEWLPAAKLGPIQCNTSLKLLRLFGRYVELGTLLPRLGFDVLAGLAQLFDYYFYAVTKFFGSDSIDRGFSLIHPTLAPALRRLDSTFSLGVKLGRPHVVGFSSTEALFALPARIVAVESLIYCSQQISSLESRLEALLSPDKRVFLQQFLTQTVGVAPHLRELVYGTVGTRAINFTYLLHAVTSDVNWAIGELLSQHSTYIDYLLKDFAVFGSRLESLGRAQCVPWEAYAALWRTALGSVCRALVEGYSRARKCSTEGRALMQLDFQQFLRNLEGLTKLRPIPARDFVDGYIKAYYVPESEIEAWIKSHPEYSSSQIAGLLQVATHISRKTRSRLTQEKEAA